MGILARQRSAGARNRIGMVHSRHSASTSATERPVSLLKAAGVRDKLRYVIIRQLRVERTSASPSPASFGLFRQKSNDSLELALELGHRLFLR